MRDILFKAKRKDNGEWVEGYYEKYNNRHYINKETDRLNTGGYPIREFIEVDENTICQCTDLTDRNGNKIWENDILNGHKNPKDLAKVVFGEFCVIDVETLEKVDGVIGWHTETIPTDAISRAEPFCLPMPLTDFYVEFSEWEVIGNIFDNPELVEEVQNEDESR